MNLAEMIVALELIHRREEGPTCIVTFSFCGAFPNMKFSSSRCYYERLAMDWTVRRRSGEEKKQPPTVGALLQALRDCKTMRLVGYKGGEWGVNERLPVHVDGYGECTSTVVKDIRDLGWCVVIDTAMQS